MAVAVYLRKQGIHIFMYLDDWLVLARSEAEAVASTRTVIQVAEYLGFLINRKKSHLVPTQVPTYLGAVLNLETGVVTPSMERVESVIRNVEDLKGRSSAPARQWMRCLGLMASLVEIVPWCRLRMRAIQLHLARHYSQMSEDLDILVPVHADIHQHLDWWLKEDHLLAGVRFPALAPQVTLVTDASNLGWGGHVGPQTVSGVWNAHESGLHINALEMLAVEKSLIALLHLTQGRRVLVKSDNATTVAYLNKQGGTHSPTLCWQAIRLLLWAEGKGITLSAVHIPGVDNAIADSLSRGLTVAPTEWSLNQQVAQRVFQIFGEPVVDLFASRTNKILPVYCSRTRDEAAYAQDALSISWEGMVAYAFPPIPVIPLALQKMCREESLIILIAPFWPRRPWFPMIMQLLVDVPLILPPHPDLLRIPHSKARFHDVKGLHLTAWKLSAGDTLRRAFLDRLPPLFQQDGDPQPTRYTLHVSDVSTTGVKTRLLIRPRHLHIR
jgi:hypothetical protein